MAVKTKPSAKKAGKQAVVEKTPALRGSVAPEPRIFAMSFASVYPLYVAKVEKKGRSKAEVDCDVADMQKLVHLEGRLHAQWRVDGVGDPPRLTVAVDAHHDLGVAVAPGARRGERARAADTGQVEHVAVDGAQGRVRPGGHGQARVLVHFDPTLVPAARLHTEPGVLEPRIVRVVGPHRAQASTTSPMADAATFTSLRRANRRYSGWKRFQSGRSTNFI